MNEMRKLMEALKRIDEGEVIDFPGMEKQAEPQEISMLQAFGSEQMNILNDVLPNRAFFEKPSYWEDLDKPRNTLTEFELHKLQKAFKEAGISLPTYSAYDIFGNGKPQGPMSNANPPQEKTFVVEMYDGTEYLCDSTGASSYIRMWMAIV